ncbi:hypothetical protein [Rickettsiella endosymbiont of Dermanyssus gallinae]|uniref:hypothetical protein n=1 Tax=Rickettsiella endosymbiont of Dermanyssus gallinae TaxID=2856608 RepID=UPI001C53362B|nr:hypothetical protein [Rickettsiella endosymbiont of Dermanyssus gallinae]
MARVVGSNDRICVTCLRDVEKVAFFWEPTHVLSLLDPCLPSEKSPKLEKAKHIVLRMYDQEDTGATGHFSSIIERAYEQLSSIFAKPKNKVLIHSMRQESIVKAMRSRRARDRRALTGEAGNASRRKVICGRHGHELRRSECVPDAGRIAA